MMLPLGILAALSTRSKAACMLFKRTSTSMKRKKHSAGTISIGRFGLNTAKAEVKVTLSSIDRRERTSSEDAEANGNDTRIV